MGSGAEHERGSVGDRVPWSHRDAGRASDADGGLQPLDPVGLVGPDACRQPARRLVVVDVHGRAVEPDPLDDARHRGGELDAPSCIAAHRDGRRTAQLTSRRVHVLVAVEHQVEAGAGADVDVGERPDLGGDDAEGRHQQRAAPDLVRLRAARDEQLGQLVGLGGDERPERRHRIAVVGLGGEVWVVAGEPHVGSAGEQQVVDAREEQHRLALHRWRAEEEPGQHGVGGDPGRESVVQRGPRLRRASELGEQCGAAGGVGGRRQGPDALGHHRTVATERTWRDGA